MISVWFDYVDSFEIHLWQRAPYLSKLYITVYQVDVIGAPIKMKASKGKW